MNANEIRDKFIEFFKSKQHVFVPGASTIPIGDQTLLFTIAGMTQFKSCLTGEEVRSYKRATNSQKCIRVADLDEVGNDGRHLTMFEMLGSWSFGDYYKRDAIQWAYEFVRDELKLDLTNFWATVHTSDDEAFEIWKSIGVPENRIRRLGDKDNFWAMGPTGPCGPCSELYIDQGEAVGRCKEKGFNCLSGPGCDCDRYLEFWNLVFMQFNRHSDGTLSDLPMKSVDTGSGLERVAALVQGKTSAFEIDSFLEIKNYILKKSNKNKTLDQLSKEEVQCLNVLSDHLRLMCFTLADGVRFSNEGRGYVLRRVLRRAVRYAHKFMPEMDKSQSFLSGIVTLIVDQLKDFYPELLSNKFYIENSIAQEEIKFNSTLESGLLKFNLFLGEGRTKNSKILSGENIFILHDSFGFPSDLTRILCEENGFKADLESFGKYMNEQKERSRAEAKFYKFDQDDSPWVELNAYTPNEIKNFAGYNYSNGGYIPNQNFKKVRFLENKYFELVIANTPFYPEGGGQVADKGCFVNRKNTNTIENFEVVDVRKTNSQIIHLLKSDKYSENSDLLLNEKDLKEIFDQKNSHWFAEVDLESRSASARNHTATHLMHKALQVVLGDQVRQAGSLVQPSGLRFDFTHSKSMTMAEIEKVEQLVNLEILKNTNTITHEKVAKEEAKLLGAMAMFDEKYDDFVRVVEVPNFSMELCGGIHVHSTGEIGLFKIISESGVTNGVRRLECLTGFNSLEYVRKLKQNIAEVSDSLKCSEIDVLNKIKNLKENIKNQDQELIQVKSQLANFKIQEFMQEALLLQAGLQVVIKIIENSNLNELEIYADKLKEKTGTIAVLASVNENKFQIICAVSKDVVQLIPKISAGNVIKHVCQNMGGKGGGRNDFAKGGGPQGEQLIIELKPMVEKYLKGCL